MRFLRTALILSATCCVFTPTARAQDTFDTAPAYLSIVDGSVTLDREDAAEAATTGVPLVPGDRVHTDRGRAEILFPDGSAIDLDEYTSIELQGPTNLFVTNGRVFVVVGGPSASNVYQFQIDTPIASAQTDGRGEYRVSVLGSPSRPQIEMAVLRGSGALVTEHGTMPLRSGELSIAVDNALPGQPQFFNASRYDAFEQWAMGLREQRLGSRSASAQYLPQDLQQYGGYLDRNGSWDYEAPYGYVWYPSVGADWRPYYDGYWSSVPTYGWTWIGVDVWSWPTHHYGRWGYSRSRWFWIPDRRWSPAWVSWGGASNYVSWCPLGYDNRPVFALSIGIGGGRRGDSWRGDTWRGWTVVSRDHFGGRRNVHQFAVSGRSLPANVGFVAERSAPVSAPRAIARRGFGNGRPANADRRQFPNVFSRPGDGRATRATGITRSPQNAARQPQLGQPPQRSEPGSVGDRRQAIPRRQSPSTAPQYSGRPSDAGQNRGVSRSRRPDTQTTLPVNPRENRPYTARPRSDRPASPQQAPAIVPNQPQRSERPNFGNGNRRAEPIRPPQQDNQEPRISRRSGGAIYTQRPTPQGAPPVQQAAPRQERPSAGRSPEGRPQVQRENRGAGQPHQEQPRDQGRSRGHENRQSSGNDRQQGGGQPRGNGNGNGGNNGHHRR